MRRLGVYLYHNAAMDPVKTVTVSVKISTNPDELETIDIKTSDSGFQISNSVAARYGLFQKKINLYAVFEDGHEEEVNAETEFHMFKEVKWIRVEVEEFPSRALSANNERKTFRLLKANMLNFYRTSIRNKHKATFYSHLREAQIVHY